jgi:hypothetical protein
MVIRSDKKTEQALVSCAIEKALLDIGGNKLFYEVCLELYTNFRCYITDCYEHPQYLTRSLRSSSMVHYSLVIKEIKTRLEEFSDNQSIGEFLQKISREILA